MEKTYLVILTTATEVVSKAVTSLQGLEDEIVGLTDFIKIEIMPLK